MADFKETQRVERRISDAKTGAESTHPVSGQSLTVSGNERVFRSEQGDIAAVEGKVVPANHPGLAMCRDCDQGPFSQDAVAQCRCGFITCKRCGTLHGEWRCKRCNRRRLLWEFLGLFRFWMVIALIGGIVMIDERGFQKRKQLVEATRLWQFDPTLRDDIGRIRPEANNPADDLHWPHIAERIDALLGEYENTGVINVPPAFLPAGFPVALQDKTDAVVNISDGGNTIIGGPPGQGKTTLKHHAVLAAKVMGKTVILLDGKDDDVFLTTLFPFTTIDERWDKNILERPPWRSVEQFIDDQVDWFCLCFYGGEQQSAVLRKALQQAFASRPDPSWQDVHRIVDELGTKSKLFPWQQACLWVSQKIHKIRARYPKAYGSRTTGHIAALNTDLYIPLETTDQAGEWLGITILDHVFGRAKAAGDRTVMTVAFVDEAIGLVSKDEHGRIAGNPLTRLWVRSREFGPLIIMTLVSLSQADPTITTTASTIAILPGMHETSLRVAGLSPLQAGTARHLRRGQVMFVYPGRLPWPVIARFNPLPPGLKERRPAKPPHEPPHEPPYEPPCRPPCGSLPVPSSPVDQLPLTVPPAPTAVLKQTATAAPSAPEEPVDPRPAGEAILSPLKVDFLRYVGERVVVKTKETYTALDLHPERGNSIKQDLIGLGYLVAGKLTTQGGRGGGAANGMMLTTTGYRRIGMTPPARSVGTGLQGAYLCQQYVNLIPRAVLELDIAGKRPDLVVRIDAAIHGLLIAALHDQSVSWTNHEYDLPDGSLLAVEVETGDASNVLRSVRNNIAKNRAAGLQYVVFAVMPSQFARVLPIIREENDNKLLAVDAIKFLDALRQKGRS